MIMLDVIIPYYNDRPGLIRALSSLVAQTILCEVKITVVDDCSPESVDDIINFFGQSLPLTYYKLGKNCKYPGLVRQFGIDNTTEPYIMFLDSDDMLSNVAIETALKAVKSSQTPFIQGYFTQQVLTQDQQLQCVNKTDEITWLHGNIYQRDFLSKYNIRFPKGYNEDMAFNILCRFYNMPNGVCQTNMYYWLYNQNSLTRDKKSAYYTEGDRDYVYNLMVSYRQLINEPFDEQKKANLTAQIGCSIVVFYEHLLNKLSKIQSDNKRKQFENAFYESYHPFADEINKFIAPHISGFKSGLCQTYLSRQLVKKDQLTLNQFLQNMHINIEITPDDFGKGI